MKKILSILLVVTICITSLLALISCNDETPSNENGDTKITYTVTVKNTDGTAVSGVKLMFSDEASIFQNKETDANGKAELQLDAENANLGIMITSVPTGYEKPDVVKTPFHAVFGSEKDVTITLEKPTAETISYKVKVVDQTGAAVAGVEVQICHTVCVQCDLTDANGETVKELSASVAESTLKVGVLNVPEGYTIPEATVDGGYHATIAPGDTEVTVTITKN